MLMRHPELRAGRMLITGRGFPARISGIFRTLVNTHGTRLRRSHKSAEVEKWRTIANRVWYSMTRAASPIE